MVAFLLSWMCVVMIMATTVTVEVQRLWRNVNTMTITSRIVVPQVQCTMTITSSIVFQINNVL